MTNLSTAGQERISVCALFVWQQLRACNIRRFHVSLPFRSFYRRHNTHAISPGELFLDEHVDCAFVVVVQLSFNCLLSAHSAQLWPTWETRYYSILAYTMFITHFNNRSINRLLQLRRRKIKHFISPTRKLPFCLFTPLFHCVSPFDIQMKWHFSLIETTQ